MSWFAGIDVAALALQSIDADIVEHAAWDIDTDATDLIGAKYPKCRVFQDTDMRPSSREGTSPPTGGKKEKTFFFLKKGMAREGAHGHTLEAIDPWSHQPLGASVPMRIPTVCHRT